MTISIIAAITRDLGLGRNGQLLYHISADLRRFKQLTLGHPIIMGRHTFESFPKGPLPGRRNIVVSRNPHYRPEGVEVYASLDEAIKACAGADKVYIIGGGQIYAQAMELAHELELTCIDVDSPDADTRFPAVDFEQWQEVASEASPSDSQPQYRFVTLRRR